MTRIEDFSQEAQDKIDSLIDKPFPDEIPELEIFFGHRTGGLTRGQLVWLEMFWREFGTAHATERDVWDELRQTHERQRFPKRKPSVRREVVIIFGHRVTVFRDIRTGRFVRRLRR
jgi:hypothetical protein